MREPHLFEFVSLIKIPDDDEDLLVNDDYKYVRVSCQSNSMIKYVYLLHNRHTRYTVVNIPDNEDYDMIQAYNEYLKLKYG